jgi:single-stranded DNA-binding protein
MEGFNSVKMRGFLLYPKSSVTSNGYPKFSGKIAVPITYKSGDTEKEGRAYHNIVAFGSTAEALGEMLAETPIEIDGHLNSRSYDGPCKSCGAPEKKYWTEVQINNFIIITE